MAKKFNVKRIHRRQEKPRVKKLGRKHFVHNWLKKERIKKREVIKKEIASLKLPEKAIEIIKTLNLPANSIGKKILRQALRIQFLWHYEQKGKKINQRLKVKEKVALILANQTAKIETLLWKYKFKAISIKDTSEIYKAIAKILKYAKNKIKNEDTLEKITEEERKLKQIIRDLEKIINENKSGHKEGISRQKMIEAAKLGQMLVDRTYVDLPEFSQIGFQIIDKVVIDAFGEGQ